MVDEERNRNILKTTIGFDTRVRLATPAPGGELHVGDTGSVQTAWRRANVYVVWDKDGIGRRIHRKRLEILQSEGRT